MKRYNDIRVEEIIDLWLSYVDKNDKHDAIAGAGPTMMGKFADFKGELPESSNFKPETLSGKVEKQLKIVITSDERNARALLMALPLDLRCCISIWPQIRKKDNPLTGEPHKESDSLEYLKRVNINLTFQQYADKKAIGEKFLVRLARHCNFLDLNIGRACA